MSDAERWRAGDLVWLPLDRTTTIATPRQGSGAIALPASLAKIVRGLREFRTLEEHVADATRRFSLDETRAAALQRDLVKLSSTGALLGRSTVLATAAAGARPRLAKVERIAISTCSRPALLERALTGRIPPERARALTYVVLDDSRDEKGRSETRERAAHVAASTGASVLYAGAAEKRAFVRALAGAEELAGVDPKVIELGLLGDGDLWGAGANRNCARLAGPSPLGFMDDDVTGLASRAAETERIALSSRRDVTDFHFYPDNEAAARAAGVGPIDILTEHERYLGKSAGGLFADASFVELDDAGEPLLSDIGSVYAAVTTNGIAGDAAMAGVGYYIFLTGANRARLWSDYAMARATRSIVRRAATTTLSDGGFFMSPSFCLDESDPLPPFFPVHRNSDGSFGTLLRALGSPALICHLPTVIDHRPDNPRAPFPQAGSKLGLESVSTPDVLHWLMLAFTPSRREPIAARTASFARYLREAATLSEPSFQDLLRARRLAALSAFGHALEEHESQPGAPPQYLADVKAERAFVRAAATASKPLSPADLGADPEAALRKLRGLLAAYADLIDAWPQMLAASARLRAEGVELGHPV